MAKDQAEPTNQYSTTSSDQDTRTSSFGNDSPISDLSGNSRNKVVHQSPSFIIKTDPSNTASR